MNPTKRLWIILVLVLIGTFMILGIFGREVYRQAPPIPDKVFTEDGTLVTTKTEILNGQRVWQSIGGQQVGSIWGHGAYQAPDWSADWLHREAVAMLDIHSLEQYGKKYSALPPEQQAAMRQRIKQEMRTNNFNPENGQLYVSQERFEAIQQTGEHYNSLFSDDPFLAGLRESYALHNNAVPNAENRQALNAFFFWTAWACVTERPDSDVTYTNNWPHESLVGNHPTSANLLWSIISIVLLIAGVGALVWYKVFKDRDEESFPIPKADPLGKIELTPSMRALWKYVAAVIGLFVLQVGLGALTAHYTIEGNAFFGIPLANWLPYAVSRTWHVQLAVFWIATAFLTAGLFLAPLVGGKEPKFQKLGVNVLFAALVTVVLGSLAGEWMSVMGKIDIDLGFWFGHQGYEYLDLGRAWQIALFVGLILWLVLMLRGLYPALKRRDNLRQLVIMFTGSAAAIGLFYGAGFFYGAKTHLSVMEYWRWWVVHLWVEGFMEVFATVAISFIFTRLGLIRAITATRAVILSAAIFLVGGIPGTFHHLYFSGTPVSIMAIGASFSALEVVPLALVGFEAWETYRHSKGAQWINTYKWPIRFFMGVAFWNLVGAGLFGFMINPPIALYYMQGLNTTPVHAHTALFGVYGLLALGLTLLVTRKLKNVGEWNTGALRLSFWSMNIGLASMVVLSLLPIGLMQAAASINNGLWYARSAEYLQQPLLETLRWMRMVGDTIFLFGVAALVWHVVGVVTGWSFVKGTATDGFAGKSEADAVQKAVAGS